MFLQAVECFSLSVENTNKQFILPTAQTKMFEDISFVCTTPNLCVFESHRQGAYCMMNTQLAMSSTSHTNSKHRFTTSFLHPDEHPAGYVFNIAHKLQAQVYNILPPP